MESDERVKEAEIRQRDTRSHLRETVQKKNEVCRIRILNVMFGQGNKLLSLPPVGAVGISEVEQIVKKYY